MKSFTCLLLCLLLCSCNRYVVTLNDRQVYQPAESFSEFSLADKLLETCIRQTIKDNHIIHASDLHTLNCSQGAITSLTGIELFSQLRNINLSGNRLTSITPLLLLSSLEEVILTDNPELKCAEITQLTNQTNARIRLPKQCMVNE